MESRDCAERRVGRTRTQSCQELLGRLRSARQLVLRIETPGRGHGQGEGATLLQHRLVDVRVPPADLDGNVGKVELDGTSAAGFEVDEQRADLRVEDVSGVWLTV